MKYMIIGIFPLLNQLELLVVLNGVMTNRVAYFKPLASVKDFRVGDYFEVGGAL